MSGTQTGIHPHKTPKGLTLAQYVQRRTGMPLGASGSLRQMLYRSFGAGSFAQFWQHWNPIWGYALGRYIYAPLRRILPAAFALLLTFVISGVVHDGVTILVRRSITFLFTPWFFLMAVVVIIGQALHLDYSRQSWARRMMINLCQIAGCLGITFTLRQMFSTLAN